MAPAKRPPPVIDLTGEPEPKQARHSSQSSRRTSSQHAAPYSSQSSYPYQSGPSSTLALSQLPPSTWADEDENDMFLASQPAENGHASTEFYGSLDNKIVGVRYYNGLINPGEMILCRREPGNPYDRNAIRVDNVMGQQIGHIPRNVAAKIAPYIDSKDIILEGVLTGHKGPFDCPVRLYFYGTNDPTERLRLEERLKADKLVKATQLKKSKKEAEAQRAITVGLKNSRINAGLADSEQAQGISFQELQAASEQTNFHADIDSIDVFAQDESTLSKLPTAGQPDSIKSQLLPYQLQGLAWMSAKESPQVPAPGSRDVVQLWKRNQRDNFQNLVSGHITTSRPALLSGGLLSDDMGLGKTLQIISLIMTAGFGEGPTLIIAPVSVISNWEQQISEHVKHDKQPRILRYHRVPKGGSLSRKDFLKQDVVITSYGKLSSNFRTSDKAELFSVNWRRVVLDEGHVIRNPNTQVSKAACALQATSRWILSGTPIVNDSYDFHSILHFLRIRGGIEEKAVFALKIARPLAASRAVQNGQETRSEADVLLQSLVQDLCLRRTKDMKFIRLELPNRSEYIHRITLREDEQSKYNAILANAQEVFTAYERGNRRQGDVSFGTVLEQLLRLRQMCCHWTLCGDKAADILKCFESLKTVPLTKENIQILQDALQAAIKDEEECPICYEAISVHKPAITACKHRFGEECILKAISSNGKCPMCRQELNENSLIEFKPVGEDSEEDSDEDYDGDTRSSKTEALEHIVSTRLKNPGSKVVVFSQWTSFLDVIEKRLLEAGHKLCRLDGTMSPKRRDQSISALYNDPDTRVMLASLNACAVGINLVAADTVVLADSWWAPAIEDQAVNRVHRIGQTRDVTVWRLIVDKSVEERVLSIQEEKRKLVAMAFQEKQPREKVKETRRADIKKLLKA
ncbi:RAD5-like protein [Xylariomycetidae sp. FL2044]|nr:RAD5-like protein [Xylariomycetidae sp. FL2044]